VNGVAGAVAVARRGGGVGEGRRGGRKEEEGGWRRRGKEAGGGRRRTGDEERREEGKSRAASVKIDARVSNKGAFKFFSSLAVQNRPRDPAYVRLVYEYMFLPCAQKAEFKQSTRNFEWLFQSGLAPLLNGLYASDSESSESVGRRE